jgi:indole-3-glycerol phosphate synthase
MNRDILQEILQHKRAEVEKAKADWSALRHPSVFTYTPRQSRKLTRTGSLQLIAEIKRKSPSKGVIRPSFDPEQIARSFVEQNASAISVLTESKYFGGSLGVLETVRAEVDLPILRKDFIVDPFQIYESKAAGADIVLLIARAVPHDLEQLTAVAVEIGLQVLIEVHNAAELDLVVKKVAPSSEILIGVNNRDLATLTIDMNTCLELAARIPDGYLKVAESGIACKQDLEAAEGCGYDAVLIGTGLATNPDIVDYFVPKNR